MSNKYYPRSAPEFKGKFSLTIAGVRTSLDGHLVIVDRTHYFCSLATVKVDKVIEWLSEHPDIVVRDWEAVGKGLSFGIQQMTSLSVNLLVPLNEKQKAALVLYADNQKKKRAEEARSRKQQGQVNELMPIAEALLALEKHGLKVVTVDEDRK